MLVGSVAVLTGVFFDASLLRERGVAGAPNKPLNELRTSDSTEVACFEAMAACSMREDEACCPKEGGRQRVSKVNG